MTPFLATVSSLCTASLCWFKIPIKKSSIKKWKLFSSRIISFKAIVNIWNVCGLTVYLLLSLLVTMITEAVVSDGMYYDKRVHSELLRTTNQAFLSASHFSLSSTPLSNSLCPTHPPTSSLLCFIFLRLSPSLVPLLFVPSFIFLPRSLSFFIMHQLLRLMSTSVKAWLMKSLSFAIRVK